MGIFNILYNLEAAHRMTPSAYGELAALVSFANICLIPSDVVTLSTSTIIASTELTQGRSWWTFIQRRTLRFTLMVVGGIFVLSPLLRRLFHVPSVANILLVAAIIIVGYPTNVNFGIFQGRQNFAWLGLIQASSSIARFLALIGFIALGWTVQGGIVALLVSSFMGFALTSAYLHKMLPKTRQRQNADYARYSNVFSRSVAITISNTLFLVTDTLIARHFLGRYDAGLFISLSIVGKIVSFGTGFVPTILFPHLVRFRAQLRRQVLGLMTAIAIILAITVPMISMPIPVYKFLVDHLLGADYAPILPYIRPYLIAYTLYGLAMVFAYFLLASGARKVWGFLVIGFLTQLGVFGFLHSSIRQMVLALDLLFGTLLLVGVVLTIMLVREHQDCQLSVSSHLP